VLPLPDELMKSEAVKREMAAPEVADEWRTRAELEGWRREWESWGAILTSPMNQRVSETTSEIAAS